MSTFFGVFNRDLEQVSDAVVEGQVEALTQWAPDAQGVFHSGEVALGHAMLWNSPESKLEQLPRKAQFGERALVITSDMRLDNRWELAEKLRLDTARLAQTPDSELVLTAYLKWGEDCPRHLLGDFAFAIWDAENKSLFCARDHVGVKQLYYHLDAKRLVIANDIRAVVAHPDVPNEYDDRMVFSYIYEINQPDITFFRTVRKLPAASSITVSPDKYRIHRYWRPEDSPPVRYNCVQEYADALSSLLQSSVEARSRSLYPVSAHLSGGLDSSPLAVLAARCLKKENQTLHAFSWLNAPGIDDKREHFEWSNGERIARAEGMDYRYIDMNEDVFERVYAQHDIRYMDTLDFWNEFAVRDAVRGLGSRTILSGWGGDELISFDGGISFNAELLWQGRVLIALGNYLREAKQSRFPPFSLARQILRQLVLPFFSTKRFDAAYNFLSKSFYIGAQPLAYLPDDFAALAGTHYPRTPQPPRKFGQRWEQFNRFYLGTVQNRLEAWGSSAHAARLEYRYPLLDKRIVEFALGMPLELYSRQGTDRYLFRYTIENLIPRDIAWSETKFENERADRHNCLMHGYLRNLVDGGSVGGVGSNRYVDQGKLLDLANSVAAKLDLDDIATLKKMMIAGKGIHLSKLV